MYNVQAAVKPKFVAAVFLLTLYFCQGANDYLTYALDGNRVSFGQLELISQDHVRSKRDIPPGAAAPAGTAVAPTPAPAPIPTPALAPAVTVATANTSSTNTNDINRTTNINTTASSPAVPVSVTQVPLLGANGTGILRVNLTDKENTPKVSDPIFPDDNFKNMFNETPETLKAEQNISTLKYDDHEYYKSTFIGNKTYFDEYWANLTKYKADVHPILSNSHRRAITLKLKFKFRYYGHNLDNITVATGGFLYTGTGQHTWLAATQYIAPLMANFDTTITNDSFVKVYNDDERFTAFWENVAVQEDLSKKFTFAATLYQNGDIDFAYKDMPVLVQNINDEAHPVKVGISDAYLNERFYFLVRRKTINEYHRVSFKDHEITNSTILRLTALPTCLQYNSCATCVNHDTGFDCLWCEAIQSCSTGTDRNKQNWVQRNCDKNHVSNESSCPSLEHLELGMNSTHSEKNAYHEAVVNTMNAARPAEHAPMTEAKRIDTHTPIGGVVAAFVGIALVVGLAAWALYAFKNPHTRSGQLLIKYRPSQWNWRRGEARYTAATIHM